MFTNQIYIHDCVHFDYTVTKNREILYTRTFIYHFYSTCIMYAGRSRTRSLNLFNLFDTN